MAATAQNDNNNSDNQSLDILDCKQSYNSYNTYYKACEHLKPMLRTISECSDALLKYYYTDSQLIFLLAYYGRVLAPQIVFVEKYPFISLWQEAAS